MATERMPQRWRCWTRASRSWVKAPKRRMGSGLRSAGTATQLSVAPMSMPAAAGCASCNGVLVGDGAWGVFGRFMVRALEESAGGLAQDGELSGQSHERGLRTNTELARSRH